MASRAKRRAGGGRRHPLFWVRPPARGRRQQRALSVADGFSFLLMSQCSGVVAAPMASGAEVLLVDWWPTGHGLQIWEEKL
jgi:hypothetical protein